MSANRKPINLLMADDDLDDCLLTQEALVESLVLNQVRFVNDGEQLLAYLRREGEYAELTQSPHPDLILLDLNMPRKDGREALRDIKADPALRLIPIVVLTTSKAEEDILRSYNLGASAFITKPVTFEGLVDVMRSLGQFWFEIVTLPPFKDGERYD